MDRQGYDTGSAGYTTGTGKPMGQKIKEAIPGTSEYQATHGTTGAHSTVEQMKTYIPGTEEHRMSQAGVIGGPGHHTTGTGHTGPTMGERIAQNIPGTDQYEATHGMTGAHRGVEQAKAHIPGTEEHRIYEGTRPGHGTGGGILGTSTGPGLGSSHESHGHTAGSYDTGYGTHDVTGTGVTGTGVGAGEHKSMGQKVKEVIPGTREHEAKKLEQGRY